MSEHLTCTLTEITTSWTLDQVQDAHDILDAYDKAHAAIARRNR